MGSLENNGPMSLFEGAKNYEEYVSTRVEVWGLGTIQAVVTMTEQIHITVRLLLG